MVHITIHFQQIPKFSVYKLPTLVYLIGALFGCHGLFVVCKNSVTWLLFTK